MRGYLIRIGVDQAFGGWNAPMDPETNEFVYVPIPESRPMPRVDGDSCQSVQAAEDTTAPGAVRLKPDATQAKSAPQNVSRMPTCACRAEVTVVRIVPKDASAVSLSTRPLNAISEGGPKLT